MQRRVLENVADGRADKEIASRLGISEAGAKKHLEKLRRRYGVDNRVSLLRAALEAGDLRLGRRTRGDR
jgi:DNA-binding CsgD family transcriptional regulator